MKQNVPGKIAGKFFLENNMGMGKIIDTSATWFADLQYKNQKAWMDRQKNSFFNEMFDAIKSPPDKASVLFGQADLIKKSKITEELVESQNGLLMFKISANFYGIDCLHQYSLFLTGDIFRIGVLLFGEMGNAFVNDFNNEYLYLWPGTACEVHTRTDMTLHEWVFAVPDLYSNHVTRDRFILGMRHMHGRVLSVISDYCKQIVDNQAVDV